MPGRVFKGQECLILDAIASGQMQATGTEVRSRARSIAPINSLSFPLWVFITSTYILVDNINRPAGIGAKV